jgi:hypothetical protein
LANTGIPNHPMVMIAAAAAIEAATMCLTEIGAALPGPM